MYIGQSQRQEISLSKWDGTAVKYENKIFVPWNEVVSSGIYAQIKTELKIISSVKILLGENFAPTEILLLDPNKEKVITSYRGETGKAITEKEITLTLDEEISDFVLSFDSSFTDIEVEKIEVYGADLSGTVIFPTPEKMEETGRFFDISTLKTVEKTDENIKANGYTLTVNEKEITLCAKDKRGFTFGRSTVEKLTKNGKIPEIRITDNPFCSFRGVHLYLPALSQMDFAKKLVKNIIAPMGYNHLIIEICGAMEFESHPEINEKYVEANEKYAQGIWPKLPHGTVGGGTIVKKEDIRDFCAYVRSFGIEIIPEIQSLGHVQFMTLAHPEIAEIPENKKANDVTDERLADIPPDEFYAHSFCPSNEKSYEILFDLMDEIIDTFEPEKYVHMGHDEIYQIGVCPICSKKDPADIYVEDILKLHKYLAEKNLKMMIWADMLQPVSAYKTVSAIDRIPKDIVLLDFIWYFHTDKDIEKNLTVKGFDVIIGNLYSSHFPRFEKRIRGEKIHGGQISAWVQTNEESLQREGKLYDFIYTAQMLWSESYTENCRYVYDRIIRSMIPALRAEIQGVKEFEASKNFFRGKAKELDITVNSFAKTIAFTHGTDDLIPRTPWAEGINIGNYQVTYADNTSVEIPLISSLNIFYSGRRQNAPFENGYYRHNGYMGSWATDEIRVSDKVYYRYLWQNPHPEKEIAKITLNTNKKITIIDVSAE